MPDSQAQSDLLTSSQAPLKNPPTSHALQPLDIQFTTIDELKKQDHTASIEPGTKVIKANDVVFEIKPVLNQTFTCVIESYLKDSNAYGNIYFSRYFEWQGVCREKWFSECIVKDMFKLDGVLITKTAHIDYCHELFPFQKIKAMLNTRNIRNASFDIIINFIDEKDTIIANGYQTIIFASKTKKISRFPEDILKKVALYQKLI